jgi:hypothetical protein
VRALLVRYAPEVQAALKAAQAEAQTSLLPSLQQASQRGLQTVEQQLLPASQKLATQLVDGLSAAARGEATFDGTLSVGSVRLRAGMPLTELSPQLPQLSEELAQLAQDLQSSSQGRALLDSLAAAATDAAKAGSELYATAADTASPVLQQAATEAGAQLQLGVRRASPELDKALLQGSKLAAEALQQAQAALQGAR